MKKNYINPQVTILRIDIERIVAASEKMERGAGSGGNTPEVKRDRNSTEFSNPVNWDE